MDGFSSSGLLDYFPTMGSVVAVASQGRFSFFLHPSLGDVVADASQGRFFFFFYTPAWAMLSQLPRRGVFFFLLAVWPKKVICGQKKEFLDQMF